MLQFSATLKVINGHQWLHEEPLTSVTLKNKVSKRWIFAAIPK